jgi:hypothetical protein
MFDTDPDLWIAVAAMQFEGDAAQWMSSVHHKFVCASWLEFCTEVLFCFGKNQHQSSIRKLCRLRQTSTVAAYISAFSALMDQLTVYEPNPDMLHYIARFIDGLKPVILLLVAVQRSIDLDTTYSIAFVQEDLGDDDMEFQSPRYQRPHSSQSSRYSQQIFLKFVDDTKHQELAKFVSTGDDKLATLKAYMRAKGDEG